MNFYDAIWDTGATNSGITQAVITACGLVATGMTQVHGVHGAQLVETYLVDIQLPNSLTVNSVRVTKSILMGADVLVGMDIMNLGDFAITNFGGQTRFTFRMPSKARIDFVQEQKRQELLPAAQHGGSSKGRKKRRH